MGYNRLGNELSVINSFAALHASTDDVQVGPSVQGNYILTENTACACRHRSGYNTCLLAKCTFDALVLHIEIHYCSTIALTVLKMMQVQPQLCRRVQALEGCYACECVVCTIHS